MRFPLKYILFHTSEDTIIFVLLSCTFLYHFVNFTHLMQMQVRGEFNKFQDFFV